MEYITPAGREVSYINNLMVRVYTGPGGFLDLNIRLSELNKDPSILYPIVLISEYPITVQMNTGQAYTNGIMRYVDMISYSE